MENPAIKRIKAFQEDNAERLAEVSYEKATYNGVIQKELAMLVLVVAAAAGVIATGYATPVAVLVSSVMALVTGLMISFKPTFAPTLTPAYALLEGMALGGLSYMLEMEYPDIVIQAVMLTFAVALGALFVFGKGIVKVDSTFVKVTTTALFTVLIFSIGKLVAAYFFGVNFEFFESGIVGIMIDVLVIGVATMSLFVDYEQIKETVETGLPKEYEWVCAFSLLVTLIWLYIRILELLRTMRK